MNGHKFIAKERTLDQRMGLIIAVVPVQQTLHGILSWKPWLGSLKNNLTTTIWHSGFNRIALLLVITSMPIIFTAMSEEDLMKIFQVAFSDFDIYSTL